MPDQVALYNFRPLPFGLWLIEWYMGGVQCAGVCHRRGKKIARLLNVEHWKQIEDEALAANLEEQK